MIDVRAEIAGLVQRIKDAAVDEHEARGVILAGVGLLQLEFTKAQSESNEAFARLALEKRAVETGVSVADQKNAIGMLKKMRAEDVSAAEVIDAPIFAVTSAAAVEPAPKPPLLKP